MYLNEKWKLWGFLPIILLTCWMQAGTGSSSNRMVDYHNTATAVPATHGTGQQDTNFHLQETYGKLPLHFEPNVGQTDRQVDFLSRGNGYTLFLTASEAVLSLKKPQGEKDHFPNDVAARNLAHPADSHSRPPEPTSQTVVRMQLVGANPEPKVEGLEELPGKSNYFIGNDPQEWRTNIPTYAKVRYQEIYPGVDLIYYGRQGQLEYDFVVAPGAAPSVIKLAFQGAEKVETDPNGDLLLHVAGGEIRLKNPNVYQVVDGVRRTIPGNYLLTSSSTAQNPKSHLVSFQVAANDATLPLVIDPVLLYSTYIGGGGDDGGRGIAVDPTGSAYVTGFTYSADFPTLGGAFGAGGTGFEVFVLKLDPTGSALVYSTFVGGSEEDQAEAIAIDSSGNVYLTGFTSSHDFPIVSAFQSTRGDSSSRDAFVTKLNSDGSAVVYSTYLGGRYFDVAEDIAVDSIGNAYVVGSTGSPDFPTVNALQATMLGCCFDAFVTKLSSTGTALGYSTFLGGGSGGDTGTGIAVDSAGSAFVTGFTDSTNFPTANPVQGFHHGGLYDVFVSKLTSTGSGLVYSTYLGGSDRDFASGIAVDSSGHAYVTGETLSTDFPMSNPFQGTNNGSTDVFASSFAQDGSTLLYSTYLGGSGDDYAGSIAVDTAGSAYLTGATYSADYPTRNGLQSTNKGFGDVLVTKFNNVGSALVYSTLLGGSSGDNGEGIAVDSFGNAYVTGFTHSADFPTSNPLQAKSGSSNDVFVAKLAVVVPGEGEPIPDEEVTVNYSTMDWKFLVQAAGAQIAGFEQPAFNDATFSTGSTPYGSHACAQPIVCPLDSTATTCWDSQKTLFLRKKFFVPPGTEKATVKIRSNASTSVKVFVNGAEIGSGTASACASELESFSFSTTNIAGTSNLVAIRAENFLASAFLDVQVSFQADAQVLGPLATGSYNLEETQILSGGQVVIPFTSPGHPLAVSKQFIPFPPRAGEPNIYRVFVSNISASPATVAFVSIAVGNFGIGEALYPAGQTSPNTLINPGETKQFDIVWTPWFTGHQCSRVYVGYFASDLKVMVTQWDLDVVHGISTIDTANNEYTVYNRFLDDRNFYLRFTQRNFPAGWTLTSSVPGPPPGSIPEEPSDPGFFATIPAKSTRIFTLTVNPNGIAGIGSVVVEGWLAFADTTACPFSQDERGAPVARIVKNLGLGSPSDDVLCKLGFLVKTVRVIPPETCNDGIDNDGDGLIDCTDPECSGNPACLPEVCNNGVDDDLDGFVDCADLECFADPACSEICTDGVDNDGDGLVDCADPDCSANPLCGVEICTDALDNDADGFIDCGDPDCAANPACLPPAPDLTGRWTRLRFIGGGKTLQTRFLLVNRGGLPAGSFKTDFYVSTDTSIDGSDTFVGTCTKPAGLAAGVTANCPPMNMANGTLKGKFLIAFVDSGGTVAEGNEGNNILAVQIK